jgi:hypothetical protein
MDAVPPCHAVGDLRRAITAVARTCLDPPACLGALSHATPTARGSEALSPAPGESVQTVSAMFIAMVGPRPSVAGPVAGSHPE